MAVQGYLRRADESWNNYDGNSLAALLSFQDNHVKNPKLQVSTHQKPKDLGQSTYLYVMQISQTTMP